ncbi:MAG: hypothetical protein EOL91_07225 [Actinobacteria bacterium]|nr:hypothetical protein [Actinomycetota bacterium]
MPSTIGKCSPTATQARRVLYACAVLRRAGCRILSASAVGTARIRVDRAPRLDWLQPARKTTTPTFEINATRMADIQIEWARRRTLA